MDSYWFVYFCSKVCHTMRKYIGGPKYWLAPQTLDCPDTHVIHTLGLEQLCLRFPKLNHTGVERMPFCFCFYAWGVLLPAWCLSLLWAAVAFPENHAWLSLNSLTAKKSSPNYFSVSIWIYLIRFRACMCLLGLLSFIHPALSHLATITWWLSFLLQFLSPC